MKIKDRVYGILKKSSYGLTIKELSDKLKLTRNTISIGLAELKGAKILKVRSVGKAKVHYIPARKGEKK